MMKSKFFEDFKTFALRGNVVDMAVGIIIGAAFGKVVTSIVDDIIMPPIGLLVGGVDFSDLSIVLRHAEIVDGVEKAAVSINYGNFIQTVVDFLIIAFAIFLFIRYFVNLTKKEEKPAPPPTPTKEEELLTEIRDILNKKS